MPNTTTATWPTLTAGQVGRASDVESKFDWSEHHFWPHSTGVRTNNTFDLGDSTTAYWRALWCFAWNPTTTAQGVAIGTSTVANNSDVVLEVGSPRTMLIPRFTTAQETAFTGINGMIGYNSTLNQFRGRQNGAWIGMSGAPIGVVRVVTHLAGGPVSTTAINFTGSGRVLSVLGVGSSSGNSATVLLIVDSISTGDFTTMTLPTGLWITADIGATTGSFVGTTGSTRTDVFFKNQFIVRQATANVATTSTYVTYEGS